MSHSSVLKYSDVFVNFPDEVKLSLARYTINQQTEIIEDQLTVENYDEFIRDVDIQRKMYNKTFKLKSSEVIKGIANMKLYAHLKNLKSSHPKILIV